MIKIDRTAHSLVILCTGCPWRHAIIGTGAGKAAMNHDRANGYLIGAAHERAAHDGPGTAAVAAHKAKRRAGGTI